MCIVLILIFITVDEFLTAWNGEWTMWKFSSKVNGCHSCWIWQTAQFQRNNRVDDMISDDDFIANWTCNTMVTGSFCICYLRIWHDPVIFPVIGLSVLCTANQNAWIMTQQANSRLSHCIAAHYKIVPIKIAIKILCDKKWCVCFLLLVV